MFSFHSVQHAHKDRPGADVDRISPARSEFYWLKLLFYSIMFFWSNYAFFLFFNFFYKTITKRCTFTSRLQRSDRSGTLTFALSKSVTCSHGSFLDKRGFMSTSRSLGFQNMKLLLPNPDHENNIKACKGMQTDSATLFFLLFGVQKLHGYH